MNSKAKAVMDAEWARLRAVPRPDGQLGVWDEALVQEWRDVRRQALQCGTKAHIGRIFGIVVEKNHELPEHDPKRKYKGRAVFGGDNVKDEAGSWALFQDLGSCPATMEAARAGDAYGCMPGHLVEQCDAEQAYTQAVLSGTTTWVRLPRDQWPESWNGMHDPVVPLKLALYGHPDSGGHWEQHCESKLKEAGYEPVPSWRSCFWIPAFGCSWWCTLTTSSCPAPPRTSKRVGPSSAAPSKRTNRTQWVISWVASTPCSKGLCPTRE